MARAYGSMLGRFDASLSTAYHFDQSLDISPLGFPSRDLQRASSVHRSQLYPEVSTVPRYVEDRMRAKGNERQADQEQVPQVQYRREAESREKERCQRHS
jgi:hypothetical protein